MLHDSTPEKFNNIWTRWNNSDEVWKQPEFFFSSDIFAAVPVGWLHRVQRSFVWINELLKSYLTSHLKIWISLSFSMIISPIGSLRIYCKRFRRFLSDPDWLCCSPFWKSTSQILAGAQHIAQRVTEARSAKLKKQLFHIIYCKPILRALSLLVCGI